MFLFHVSISDLFFMISEAEGAIKLHENESHDKTENSSHKNHENIIDRLAAEIELNNVEDDGSENEETDDSILENNEEIEESIPDQNDLKETDDPRDEGWSPSFASHCVTSPDLVSDEQIFHQDIVSLSTHCINNDNVELGVSESFTVHQCQDQYLLPAHDDVHDVHSDQNVQIDVSHDVHSDQDSNISCDDDKEINEDLHNNQVISTDVNMSSTDPVEIFNEVNNKENEYQNDAQEEVVIEVEESDPSTDVCHQNLVVNVVKGVEFTTSIQFNQLNMKDEEIDNFLSSMVSHQLPSVSPQEEYPTYIQSSTAHSLLKTEEEYCESLITISSHCKESYIDSGVFEDVNEESVELTEDAADEYTDYTEVEHLETIQEVSEICDVTTEITDITESEMTEEIEDFPYSLDTQTADIIQLVPLNEESDVSMIEQSEEDISQYHDEAEDQQDDEDLSYEIIELREFERNENLSLFMTEVYTQETRENSIEDFLETDTITEDYLETETSEVYEETYFGQQQEIDVTIDEPTGVEIQEDDVDSFKSMVSHTVVEAESDIMSSSASHLVNTISEENNFTSMVAHFFQYYLINSAQEQELEEISGRLQNILPNVQEESIGMFNIEEFHVFYPKVEEEKTNFYYDTPLTSMSSHQVCNNGLLEDFQEVQFITSMQSHMSTNEVNSQDQDSKLPLKEINSCHMEENLEDKQIEEEIEPQNIEERLTEEFCQLKEKTQISEINEPAAEEKENINVSEIDKNESEPVIQTYKLQLTRLQQLQKLVEDELEEFDTQRKSKVDLEQATETQVVNIVKGVEFITNIKINQVYEENEKIPTQETSLENQDLIKEEVAIKEDFNEHKEVEDNIEFFSEEDEESIEDELENLIHASCTLNYDRVSITSNIINDSQPHDNEPKEVEAFSDNIEQNEADSNSNTPLPPPRKSVNIQEEIRDRQCLNSLDRDCLTMQKSDANEDDTIEDNDDLNDNNADSKDQKVQFTQNSEQETEGKAKASILKNKSSVVKVATATLNENVKKQSYRIKFKIKLNENSPKKQTSVLRYLFGCFGGEKLFNSSLKH